NGDVPSVPSPQATVRAASRKSPYDSDPAAPRISRGERRPLEPRPTTIRTDVTTSQRTSSSPTESTGVTEPDVYPPKEIGVTFSMRHASARLGATSKASRQADKQQAVLAVLT